MSKELKEMMERIRKDMAWPEDDLLVVIHAKQKDRAKLDELLQKMGLKNEDSVEVIPL